MAVVHEVLGLVVVTGDGVVLDDEVAVAGGEHVAECRAEGGGAILGFRQPPEGDGVLVHAGLLEGMPGTTPEQPRPFRHTRDARPMVLS